MELEEVVARSPLVDHPSLTGPLAACIAVDPVLAALFAGRGPRQGSVVATSGPAGVSLLLAVLAGPLQAGSWAAVVGLPALGIEAAVGVGLRLDRLVLVPEPGSGWAEVAAGLLDAVEVVAVVAPARCRPVEARRLAARARERHGLLVVAEPPLFGRAHPVGWPEPVDLRLDTTRISWCGLVEADGAALGGREATIRLSGRRVADRERTTSLWLPAANGSLTPTGADLASVGAPAAEDPTARRAG